jgi:hypothetical protein
MFFDLVTYRFGALAELSVESEQKLKENRPERDGLVEAFRKHRRQILDRPGFRAARALIAEAAGGTSHYLPGSNERARQPEDDFSAATDVFSMPPALGIARKRRPGEPSHLVGLLPNDQLLITLDGMPWSIRVRASVTACALEVTDGFPKMWWTFEGVPAHPEKGHRLSQEDAERFLGFASRLEEQLLGHLETAYFDALGLVTGQTVKGKLTPDRLRIRFADNNDQATSALINALRFRNVTTEEIRNGADSLRTAAQGMLEFERFVCGTNAQVAPEIDPDEATAEVRVRGVEAVMACRDVHERFEDSEKSLLSIAGVAQNPGSRSAYDHLTPVKALRLRQNTEKRIRESSPSRRLSAQLAGYAALTLDDRRRFPTAAPLSAAV